MNREIEDIQKKLKEAQDQLTKLEKGYTKKTATREELNIAFQKIGDAMAEVGILGECILLVNSDSFDIIRKAVSGYVSSGMFCMVIYTSAGRIEIRGK